MTASLRPILLAVAVASAILGGCSSGGRREAPAIERAPPGAQPPSTASRPGMAGRRGGYYLDDGPGDNPPANLDAIPDAIPRAEPIRRATARPYEVMGRQYVPMTELRPYRARGVATWYGRRYHGQKTASGEVYDMYGMTAAHTTLPIPSYARVTNVRNGRTVVVRVNDRGPFHSDRLIDLSYTAAHKLGVLSGGQAMVDVESILPGTAPVVADAPAPAPAPATPREGAMASRPPPASREPIAQAPAATPVPQDAGFYLQFGAFGSRENADALIARLRSQVDESERPLFVFPRDGLFRVHSGPFRSREDAIAAADRLAQDLGSRPALFAR